MDHRKTTVAVVGAGLSGLSAAKLLGEQGVDVLVLEAQDRVGGRTYTVQNPGCGYVDLGGAYIGGKQDHVLALAKELNVDTYKVNVQKCSVFHNKGRVVKFTELTPPMGNFLANLDMNNIFRTMDQMGEEIPLDAPWDAAKAREWDITSMESFIQNMTWTNLTRKFMNDFVRLNVCTEPHEVSMLWFLWHVKRCYGTKRIFSVEDGGQERKFVGGSQQLSIKTADILRGRVLLNQAVIQVDQAAGTEVILTTHEGMKVKADYVIFAIPPILQMRITFTPSLPALRNQLIQRMPMGSVIKCMMYYRTNFWREKDMSGMAMTSDDTMPIEFSCDDTKPDGTFPCLICFIAANKARKLSHLTKQERAMKLAECFAKLFDSPEALNYTHYEEKDWSADTWSGGCYFLYMPPGVLTQFGPTLRQPVGRIHFAGTETADRWCGYIDGAISAGKRAAREVLHELGRLKKEDIWQEAPPFPDFKVNPLESTFMERHLPSVPGFLTLVSASAVCAAIASVAYAYIKTK